MQPEYHYLLHLALALACSIAVGLERAARQKPAGLRTLALVGLGSALFMIVSKYGFNDISSGPGYSLDGSRIAAQVASGVGFLGAGVIFVRRDLVRGLTTAASIWVVAAVGLAAGAGMVIIAPAGVAAYLVVTTLVGWLGRHLPTVSSSGRQVRVTYEDGKGVLREVLHVIAEHGVSIADFNIRTHATASDGTELQDVSLSMSGPGASIAQATLAVNDIHGVRSIHSVEARA